MGKKFGRGIHKGIGGRVIQKDCVCVGGCRCGCGCWYGCELNVIMKQRAILLPLRATSNPFPGKGNAPLSFWLDESKRISKHKLFDCLSELENMALLQMTPYNSDTGFGRIQLKLICKPSS